MKDLHAIREISEQPNLFRLLVMSLCPTICGRGIVKAGLLLALFGGTQRKQRKPNFRRSSDPDERESRESSVVRNVPDQLRVHTYPSLPDIDEEVSYRLGSIESTTRPPEKNIFSLDFDLERSEDEDDIAEAVNMNSNDQEKSPACNDESEQSKRSSPHVLIVGQF